MVGVDFIVNKEELIISLLSLLDREYIRSHMKWCRENNRQVVKYNKARL